MYGFALRMYDQCLGRWHATDPYEQHWLPYLAMSNNPVSFVDPDGGWDGWYDRNSVTYFVDGVQVDGWEYEGYFKNSPPGSTLSMMGSMFAGMSLPVLSFSQDRGFGMWLNEKDMVAYGLHANFNTGTGVVAAMDYDVVSHFFGINNVGHYGLSNTLIGGAKSVAEFSGGVVVGIGEGAWGTVKGLGSLAWGLVSNSPVENGIKAAIAVRGVGSAVYNYDKTWSAITATASQGWTEFVNADAYGKGKTVGHVAEAVAEIFVPVSKVAMLGKAKLGSKGASVLVANESKVLRHYTSKSGYEGIMASGELYPSLGNKYARYGAGQYFTDLVGETLENTSRILYGHMFNGKKIEYFIDVSLDGLNVIKNKPHNFLVPGLAPLSLEGRIINHGISSFK